MNLREMKTGLKRYGFDDTDPLLTWLNQSLHEFEDEFKWPFLEGTETLTINARSAVPVRMPADFRKLLALRNETGREKLRYWNIRRFEREISDLTEVGIPEVYTLVGLEGLRVWPTPRENIALRLLYTKRVEDLVRDEDVPGIPVQYHYTLVRGAAYIALQAENEEERAQVAFQGWIADLERAKRFYDSHEEDEPSAVEDVQGYGE